MTIELEERRTNDDGRSVDDVIELSLPLNFVQMQSLSGSRIFSRTELVPIASGA